MDKDKRILIVEVNWLGDVLFSTAAIRALKKMYPESFIACLLHKRCKEVLVGNPYINEIIILDETGEHRGLLGKLRLAHLLKTKKFDTAYLFHRSFTRTLICFFSGIKNRIGYSTAKRRFLLTEGIILPKETIHRAAVYLYLITRKVTDNKEELRCDFFIDEGNLAYVNSILEKENIKLNNKIVVMHPAGNWPLKRWPRENFAKLADELIRRYKVSIVFSGTQKEHKLIADILSLMHNKAINLCAMTSLKQLGALFKRADLLISGDSGPLHIAVALERPTVALFGPTSLSITGPLAQRNIAILQKEVGCVIPCYKQDCLDNRCMQEIKVEDVMDCIEENGWLLTNK